MNNIPHDRKPHPHQHIINAWAEGITIQLKHFLTGQWFDCERDEAPFFGKHEEYRIKPEPKPAYSLYAQVYAADTGVQISFLTSNRLCVDNVEFTFNGDTHELISVNKIGPTPN